MSGESRETWRLLVQNPNREKVEHEVPVPESLEELRASLGIESGQTLLTSHARHKDQQIAVERLDQLQNDAIVSVSVPKRRIFISMTPDIQKKAVIWYPGSTVDEIEKAIAKAAGLPAGTAVELQDGEATVVLSTTIPNDTHLDIRPYVVAAPAVPSFQPPERPRTRTAPAAAAAAQGSAPSSVEGRERSGSKNWRVAQHSLCWQWSSEGAFANAWKCL